MAGKPGHQPEGKLGHLGQGQVWFGCAEDVKSEIQTISQKLHDIKERHRQFRDHESLHKANKLLPEWNEELLVFCKANRRKYMIGDETMKLDKQKLEYEKMIAHYRDREISLQKSLKEAIEAKESALNRLSEIQSRLLKHSNPEIIDLSDENRPTILGTKFKQLYEDEWTDAFEFLTEKEPSLQDENSITLLYSLLKKCHALCAEALRDQHVALAEVVCDPKYFKKENTVHGPQSRPQKQVFGNDKTPNVKPHIASQMNTNSNQMVDNLIDGKLQTPIREFSKMVASEVLTNVKISDILPAIKKTGEFSDNILQNDAILKYLEKCLHLCWLMQVQYPPMQMDLETQPGTMFDSKVFETYTNRGPKIALVVWPPVYLHKDGPVVCKGYADCVK